MQRHCQAVAGTISTMDLRMKLLVTGVACTLVLVAAISGLPDLTGTREGLLPATALVERIVDGDTFIARTGSRSIRVRIIGVDAPELHGADGRPECGAVEAREFLARLLVGHRVRLLPQREAHDVYGRTLADVSVPGGRAGRMDAGGALAVGGHARLLTIAPNTAHAAQLRALATSARARGRGLWGRCEGIGAQLESPRQRRAGTS